MPHAAGYALPRGGFQREVSIMATHAMPVQHERVDDVPEPVKVRSFGLGFVGVLAVMTSA